jgi:hypothetical protein
LRDLVRGPLDQIEIDRRSGFAEAPQLFGHIPTRQRVQKRQADPAGVGVPQRGDAFFRRPHLGDAAPGVVQHDLAV